LLSLNNERLHREFITSTDKLLWPWGWLSF